MNQDLIQRTMDGFATKKRSVDGKVVSLCDIGYCDVGLDDNWYNLFTLSFSLKPTCNKSYRVDYIIYDTW